VANELLIRPLQTSDIPAVAQLLRDLAEKSIVHEFSSDARDLFLAKNDESAIRNFVADGFRYHVAVLDGTLVGFVGVRSNCHLYHLFVAEALQRRGIGRRLWEIAATECRKEGNPGAFTVNSSNNAIPIYERFGFKRTAPTQNNNGVLFNPMELRFDA
jgi:ribosomal protein S18 acetylase RimI-like enzyme